jgi:DNA-binding transcriptional regulator YhcF (GntR family)
MNILENRKLITSYQNIKVTQLYRNLKKSIYICNKMIILNNHLLGGSYENSCRQFFDMLLTRNNTMEKTQEYLTKNDLIYFIDNMDNFINENKLNILDNNKLEIIKKFIDNNDRIYWTDFQKECKRVDTLNNASNKKLKFIKEYVSESKKLLESINNRLKTGHVLIKPKCDTTTGIDCLNQIKQTLNSIDLKLNL